MRKLSSKLGVFTALSVLALSGVTASCSSSDDNKELDSIYDTSNYKASFTLEGVQADVDQVHVIVVGVGIDGKPVDFKVNGEVKTAELGISFKEEDFVNGTTTYVIESTKKAAAFNCSVTVTNKDADLSLKYTIQEKGKTIINENQVLQGSVRFDKNYAF